MTFPQNKRKRYTAPARDDYSSSSSAQGGDHDFGNQSLPVAILPEDFNGVPLDGSQYLAMVRKEAAAQPSVFQAVSNPYAIASTSYTPLVKGQDRAQEVGLPDASMREAFVERFKALREALTHLPEHSPPQSYNNGGRLPKVKFTPGANRAWYRFIFRKEKPVDEDGNLLEQPADSAEKDEEDEEGDDDDDQGPAGSDDVAETTPTTTDALRPTSGPRIPTYGLLQRFTVGHFFSLLDAIPYWIAIPPQLIDGETDVTNSAIALHPTISQWCFAVLAKLDGRLTSDEISSLRVLARACIAAVAMKRSAQGTTGAQDESETGAWMIVTIVAGIWGQSDLWMDAEEDMARVAGGG